MTHTRAIRAFNQAFKNRGRYLVNNYKLLHRRVRELIKSSALVEEATAAKEKLCTDVTFVHPVQRISPRQRET